MGKYVWFIFIFYLACVKERFQNKMTPISLKYPLQNALLINQNVKFEWNSFFNFQGNSTYPISYHLYLDTTKTTSTKLVLLKDVTFYEYNNLKIPATYYWKVIGVNNKGETNESEVNMFKTLKDINVDSPLLQTPANNSVKIDLLPYLEWQHNNKGDDGITYDVYISSPGSTEANILIQKDVTNTKIFISDVLQQYSVYKWRVVAKNQLNKSASSKTFEFRTIGYFVTTIAGNKTKGSSDGSLFSAQFNTPHSIAIDNNGYLYVTDFNNHTIRRVDTIQKLVTTIAGKAGQSGYQNGNGTNALLYSPSGIVINNNDEIIFSTGNITPNDIKFPSIIRKYNLLTKQVSDFAGNTSTGNVDGIGANASFFDPHSLAIDKQNNVYVVDRSNYRIRKILPNGQVIHFAGSKTQQQGTNDGDALSAQFIFPTAIGIDHTNNNIYVGDGESHSIKQITPDGAVVTFAGGGNNKRTSGDRDAQGTNALFKNPHGVTIDSEKNIYVIDAANNKIKKITPDGYVQTIIGNQIKATIDGLGTNASLNSPLDITIDKNGNLYFAEGEGNVIRKVNIQ